MTTVACPRCRDEVTVPAGASRKALVRCPLCEEEYALSEALASLPPALIVIGGEEELEPALSAASVAEAGDDYRLAGGAYGGMLDASPSAGTVATSARPSVRGGARPKRKERSAIGEIIKIAAGGVIGLSLGMVAIWWIADRDPFNLGPTVSPYAPWMVPVKFHKKGTTAPGAGSDTATTSGSPSAGGTNNAQASSPQGRQSASSKGKSTPTVANSQAQPGNQEIASGGVNELQTLDSVGTDLPAENPLVPAGLELPAVGPEPTTPEANPASAPVEPDTEESATPKTNGKRREPVESVSTGESNSTPPQGPTESVEPSTTVEAKPIDLVRAVGAASEALTKVDESRGAPNEVRRQLFTDLYVALSEMGRVASHLDLGSADAEEPVAVMKHLVGELASQAGTGTKMNAIGTLSRGHMTLRKSGEGIAVAGAVTDFRSAGKVFECIVALGKDEQGNDVTATVVSPANPQDFSQIGDQVLVVGSVVDEPATNIAGYEGEAPRVVLLGHAAAVPNE